METREELLDGLNYVKKTITKIINIQKQQVKIVAQYREEEANISVSGVKDAGKMAVIGLVMLITLFLLVMSVLGGGFGAVIFFLVLEGVVALTWKKKSKIKTVALVLLIVYTIAISVSIMESMSIGLAVFLLILLAIIVAVGIRVVKWQNKKIDEKNAVISDQNSELHRQYDDTVQQIAKLRQELKQETSSWYPNDYYSLDAVDFFIHAISNHRADSVKEMVNLYEDSEHQKRMEAGQKNINASLKKSLLNQEQINRELMFANVMNMASVMLQSDTVTAVENNTNAVNDIKNLLKYGR